MKTSVKIVFILLLTINISCINRNTIPKEIVGQLAALQSFTKDSIEHLKMQQISDSINTLRSEAIQEMPPELQALYLNEELVDNDAPVILKILFIILFVGFWLLLIVVAIKKAKNFFRNLGYNVTEAKEGIQNMKESLKDQDVHGKPLPKEAKEKLDSVFNLLK